jgi:predicted nucleic acid-binding protein
MRSVVYDAGVLIAAERNDRRVWSEHRVRLEWGVVPLVPSAVVAQVSRSPKQVQLRRLLRGCEVVALTEDVAHRVGALLARARTRDVTDAVVVELAVSRNADIATGDRSDIERLVKAAGRRVTVFVV